MWLPIGFSARGQNGVVVFPDPAAKFDVDFFLPLREHDGQLTQAESTGFPGARGLLEFCLSFRFFSSTTQNDYGLGHAVWT